VTGSAGDGVAGRLAQVNRVVVVISGRGGVGKSYVAAALALAAGSRDSRVALLDADFAAPGSARMLGARGVLRVTPDGLELASGHSGVRVFSGELLPPGSPVRTVSDILAAVDWGQLDLLIVDLATGSDWVHDVRAFPPGRVSGLVVTIPTDESRVVGERVMRSATEAQLPLLGVVENMSGYHCGGCGETGPLFNGEAGAALASKFRVPFLGRIPFHAPRRTMEPTRSVAAPAGSMQEVIEAALLRLL
jgi:ATP-binding protein involved in chromosome partitioning